jgi:hypothetical protein
MMQGAKDNEHAMWEMHTEFCNETLKVISETKA